MNVQPLPSLWRDRVFVRFWLADNVSLAGTTITTVALPILVFQLTGSAAQTALLAAFRVLPYLLFGLIAGAIADRVDRRRLMVACNLVNTLLLGSLPLAAAFDALSLPHIYAVALLSATAFVWYDAANFGALPAIVGRERVVEANSKIWTANILLDMAAPALGGALVAALGPAQTITLDALSYVASALLLLSISRAFRRSEPAAQPAGGPERVGVYRQISADIGEGLRFLWSQRLVRAQTLLGVGNSIAGGAATGLLVVYGVRGLGLSAQDGRLGLLFTALASGALVTSLTLPWLARRWPVGGITLAGLAGNAVSLLGLAVAPDFWSGLALCAAWNTCHSLIIINAITLRQRVTPDHLQSRVNATARMIAWGGAPLGAALGGLLAELLPIRTVYAAMALIVGLTTVVGWFSPLRDRDLAAHTSDAPVAQG